MSRDVRHRLEVATVRGGAWLARTLPEGGVLGGSSAVGALIGGVLGIRRDTVRSNLRVAFPDRSDSWRRAVARRCYTHLAREAAMLLRIDGWSSERLLQRVEFDGLEALRRGAEEGPGAVLLTGHLGNWEIAGAAIAASGVPLDVVAKGMANRRLEREVVALRERLGMGVIEMEQAARAVPRALRAGRVVAMLGDQNAHRSDLFLPFFGKPAATARGPAVLAIRAGAPVFLGLPLRLPGREARYRVSFERLEVRRTDEVDADVSALLMAYLEKFERAIRAHPEQYFWQHRRWRTRPRGEPRNRH